MRQDVIKFFDDQASDYESSYKRIDDLRSFIFSERKRIVLNMLGGSFERILDIGCGPGVYADELSGRCRRLYGVDNSEEMIEIAGDKKYANAEFSTGNMEDLKFQDGFFDAAVCVGVLEYLDDIEAGIREVARVTRKGGAAIFTAPNAESLLNKLDYWMRAVLKTAGKFINMDLAGSFMNYDFQPRLFGKSTIDSLLEKYGFKVEDSKFHIFRISFLNRMNPGLSLGLAKRLNFISSRFLAINYIVKAKKTDADRERHN